MLYFAGNSVGAGYRKDMGSRNEEENCMFTITKMLQT